MDNFIGRAVSINGGLAGMVREVRGEDGTITYEGINLLEERFGPYATEQEARQAVADSAFPQ